MRLIAALVLIIGLAAAAAIYFTAEDEQPLSTSYVITIDPALTKTYVRDLERFGGKAAVLFDDFDRWFAARWRGRALGVTVAWLAVGAAGLLYWIASRRREGYVQVTCTLLTLVPGYAPAAPAIVQVCPAGWVNTVTS